MKNNSTSFTYGMFIVVCALIIAMLVVITEPVNASSPAWVKDTCWIENYLDIDFTVCEVSGGIYILTPTPTPTDRPKVKHGRPDKFTSTSVPIPTYEESTPAPTRIPRLTPTYAPTMDPWATEPGYPAPSVEPTAILTRTLSLTATSGPGYPAPGEEHER